MCKHEILISKETGELVPCNIEDKNGTYICNICGSLLKYENDLLIKQLITKKSVNINKGDI